MAWICVVTRSHTWYEYMLLLVYVLWRVQHEYVWLLVQVWHVEWMCVSSHEYVSLLVHTMNKCHYLCMCCDVFNMNMWHYLFKCDMLNVCVWSHEYVSSLVHTMNLCYYLYTCCDVFNMNMWYYLFTCGMNMCHDMNMCHYSFTHVVRREIMLFIRKNKKKIKNDLQYTWYGYMLSLVYVFEQIELQVKLLNCFLGSNKSNINQYPLFIFFLI